MNLAEKPFSQDVEIREFSPEMRAFVEANFERLDHIADEHAWLNTYYMPLMDKDIPDWNKGWYISVNRKRYERVKEAQNMNTPKMPEGYYLMQDCGHWYVLKYTHLYMKRLLDKEGKDKRFDPTPASLAEAAVYAQKHKESGLSYDQEVPEG